MNLFIRLRHEKLENIIHECIFAGKEVIGKIASKVGETCCNLILDIPENGKVDEVGKYQSPLQIVHHYSDILFKNKLKEDLYYENQLMYNFYNIFCSESDLAELISQNNYENIAEGNFYRKFKNYGNELNSFSSEKKSTSLEIKIFKISCPCSYKIHELNLLPALYSHTVTNYSFLNYVNTILVKPDCKHPKIFIESKSTDIETFVDHLFYDDKSMNKLKIANTICTYECDTIPAKVEEVLPFKKIKVYYNKSNSLLEETFELQSHLSIWGIVTYKSVADLNCDEQKKDLSKETISQRNLILCSLNVKFDNKTEENFLIRVFISSSETELLKYLFSVLAFHIDLQKIFRFFSSKTERHGILSKEKCSKNVSEHENIDLIDTKNKSKHNYDIMHVNKYPFNSVSKDCLSFIKKYSEKEVDKGLKRPYSITDNAVGIKKQNLQPILQENKVFTIKENSNFYLETKYEKQIKKRQKFQVSSERKILNVKKYSNTHHKTRWDLRTKKVLSLDNKELHKQRFKDDLKVINDISNKSSNEDVLEEAYITKVIERIKPNTVLSSKTGYLSQLQIESSQNNNTENCLSDVLECSKQSISYKASEHPAADMIMEKEIFSSVSDTFNASNEEFFLKHKQNKKIKTHRPYTLPCDCCQINRDSSKSKRKRKRSCVFPKTQFLDSHIDSVRNINPDVLNSLIYEEENLKRKKRLKCQTVNVQRNKSSIRMPNFKAVSGNSKRQATKCIKLSGDYSINNQMASLDDLLLKSRYIKYQRFISKLSTSV